MSDLSVGTHWVDCWKDRAHHGCALSRIRELEDEVDAAKAKACGWNDRCRELEAERDKLEADIMEIHPRMVTAEARIRELESAIVDFWNYAKLVLPMPVHPAVGAIMRIGQELESQSDRGDKP